MQTPKTHWKGFQCGRSRPPDTILVTNYTELTCGHCRSWVRNQWRRKKSGEVKDITDARCPSSTQSLAPAPVSPLTTGSELQFGWGRTPRAPNYDD